jgi:hypothetical protein
MLLPLALAPHETDTVRFELAPLPQPGIYGLDISVPELGWQMFPADPIEVVP